jgi:hypothetical protein
LANKERASYRMPFLDFLLKPWNNGIVERWNGLDFGMRISDLTKIDESD